MNTQTKINIHLGYQQLSKRHTERSEVNEFLNRETDTLFPQGTWRNKEKRAQGMFLANWPTPEQENRSRTVRRYLKMSVVDTVTRLR
jgi:4-alpha-glucanotransferase